MEMSTLVTTPLDNSSETDSRIVKMMYDKDLQKT
jgi:hypothetical protein